MTGSARRRAAAPNHLEGVPRREWLVIESVTNAQIRCGTRVRRREAVEEDEKVEDGCARSLTQHSVDVERWMASLNPRSGRKRRPR